MQASASSSNYLDRMISLLRFPGMREVSQSALALMAERSHQVFFGPGETLYREGMPVEYLYLIQEGNVLIRRHGVTVATAGSGRVCGAVSIFADDKKGPEAVAETPVLALRIEGRDTAEIFRDNFDLMVLGLQTMALESVQARITAGPTAGFRGEFCALPPPKETLTLADRLFYLSQSLAFAGDRVDALAALAARCTEVRLPAKTLVWESGASQRQIFIPLVGGIRGWTKDQNFSFGPGDCVGLLDALGKIPRWHHAESTSAVVALRFDVDCLLDMLEDYADLSLRLIQEVARSVVSLRLAFAENEARK